MIQNTGKYYLYRHIRLDTNEPFYIGIGTKIGKCGTKKCNYSRAFSRYNRTFFWKNIEKSNRLRSRNPFRIRQLRVY